MFYLRSGDLSSLLREKKCNEKSKKGNIFDALQTSEVSDTSRKVQVLWKDRMRGVNLRNPKNIPEPNGQRCH